MGEGAQTGGEKTANNNNITQWIAVRKGEKTGVVATFKGKGNGLHFGRKRCEQRPKSWGRRGRENAFLQVCCGNRRRELKEFRFGENRCSGRGGVL